MVSPTFLLQSKKNSYVNQGGFKVHWWKHQIGRLEQSGEMLAMGFRDCLGIFLTFELVEANGLLNKQIPESFI